MRPYMILLLLVMEIYCALRTTQVKGQILSLQGSSSAAVRDDTFQFTCTVNGGGGSLQGALSFQRARSFIPCVVNAGTCSQFTGTTGYTCECVGGQTRVFYMNITSVSTRDGGTWRCQYSNTVSSSISLDVLYGPGITSVPTNRQIIENASPDIDCSTNITAGNPSTTNNYTWTGPGGYSKDGAVLDRLINRNQGGLYTCTATNTAELSDTAQVNVTVQYASTITSVPTNLNVTENDTLGIDCSTNITPGNPSTTRYRWTGPGGYSKDGALLDRPVTRHQGGLYTCTATNTAGLSDTAQVNVNVQYRPQRDMRKQFSPTVIREINDTAAMMATVVSDPLPQFTWWRYDSGHRQDIADTTDYTVFSSDLQTVLIVRIKHFRDYGAYALRMNNSFGESILSYTVSPASEVVAQSPPDRLGQGIGVGIGVSLPVILVLVVIIVIIYRRRRVNTENVNKDHTETIEIQPHGISTPNPDGAYASLEEHTPQTNEYEKLDMGNTDKESEETIGTIGKESVYENQATGGDTPDSAKGKGTVERE